MTRPFRFVLRTVELCSECLAHHNVEAYGDIGGAGLEVKQGYRKTGHTELKR